jgi:hypothetical protein
MTRLEPRRVAALVGVPRKRCAKCKRFARLLAGETLCGRCAGMLPLDFEAGDR